MRIGPAPTLTLVKEMPEAVRRVPLLPGHRVYWTLRADFPAPHGTVYLRYSDPEDGDDCLDVLTPTAKPLQRLIKVPFVQPLPTALQALWLAPGAQKGPLLCFQQPYVDQEVPKQLWVAFPDGFSGLCSVSAEPRTATRYAWNGLRFVEATNQSLPDADDVTAPLLLPQSKNGEPTRFGATVFGGRRYFLRWMKVGRRTLLEIIDIRGRLLATIRLHDSFSATTFTILGALWINDKRQRGPVLVARDSDTVRLHVFTDDLTRLLCVQDFNDNSTSIYATTVEFSRDKHGQLVVSENYSEREGGGHTTNYTWTGHAFR